MAPTFVDLFCGIGGFRIGLEAAGFECVYANDINAAAVETYKKNRSPDATYPVECADIREVFEKRPSNIPSHHVLAAGFPCQPFTPQGKREGSQCPLHGDLGLFVVKIAAAKRPVVVLLENVPAFFNISMPWSFALQQDFKQAGYVCHQSFLSAWDFGLPQNRTRGFIVAVRDDVCETPFQLPLPPPGNPVTVRDSLLDAEAWDLGCMKKLRQNAVGIKWRKAIGSGSSWKDILDKVPDVLRTHTGIIDIGLIGQQPGKFSGRLCHDLGHIPCLTSHGIPKLWVLTRGTDQEGTIARKLHTRELCRIQGFPDDFAFGTTSNGNRDKQIGNSVPPPMVRWIGRAVAEQYREALAVVENVDEKDDRNAARTRKARKSSRKDKPRLTGHDKPKRRSRHHSRRKSRHRRDRKSRDKSREKSRGKAGHKKSEGKTNRKRKSSSGVDMAPPLKRQHLESAASPDEEPEVSIHVDGSDGNVEG